MRDVQSIPLSDEELLVLAVDNSAGVGLKEYDVVKADYEVVYKFALRVALMECMAFGAAPISVVVHNFIDPSVWETIEKITAEICIQSGIEGMTLTGSTESNFPMLQSAIGVMVVGKMHKKEVRNHVTPANASFAVIGSPLVGEEVLSRGIEILPLNLFQRLLATPGIHEILPVGSKGIAKEFRHFSNGSIECALDIEKSGGPATCAIISYDSHYEDSIKEATKQHFHPIIVKGESQT
ncbi:ATPase [Peribacillus acanthi]|uniref:ATPase n=1 Tax=Peribacillus acanthi TaxID=2171554 RepID=UPI000D3E1CA4|nr:ATPase [Peribacillus acanthi]